MPTKFLNESFLGQLDFQSEKIKKYDNDIKNKEIADTVSFTIGTKLKPFLADHGFNDMVVLPGTAYIQMAGLVHWNKYNIFPFLLNSLSFKRPIILSENDSAIEVKIQENLQGEVIYKFYEKGFKYNYDDKENSAIASIAVPAKVITKNILGKDNFPIELFQEQAETTIDSETFYRRLRNNGNQYGPNFQNITKIWVAKNQALGKIVTKHLQYDGANPSIYLAIVDSITQLLSACLSNNGRTFILSGIEKIQIRKNNLPDSLWAHATLESDNQISTGGFRGNIDVYDESGKIFLSFGGVDFKFLNEIHNDEEEKMSICIAATFTSEPLEDSLKFWSNFFENPTEIRFAPYNQVFQQLLDDQSLMRKNKDGVNIILLRLEDWERTANSVSAKMDTNRIDELFKNKKRYLLPNNLEIVHLNKYETEYVYKEIFIDKCYLKHGISLNNGDTIIDIGANIGLFSLFVNQSCSDMKVFAYEPSPVVYKILSANCKAYGSDIKTFNLGVSNRKADAKFTFYENSSVFSSFYSDEKEDQDAIRAVVRNMLKNEASMESDSLDEYVKELTEERLYKKEFEVQLTCVSDIIRDNQLERIDLLKIDAEKSELDILEGIQEEDWPKIYQIVIEIHDKSHQRLAQAESILTKMGFHINIEQEKMLEESGLYNIYAVRKQAQNANSNKGHAVIKMDNSLHRNIKEFGEALNTFMSASEVPMIVCICPRTPEVIDDRNLKQHYDDGEKLLRSKIEAIPNVYPIDSSTLLTRYPIGSYFDPEGNRLGHIPYTTEFYASLGTSLYRTVFNLKRKPFKVIVLDCDNTIWKGVCGEDGPLGIIVSQAYLRLQELMIQKMESGMLICLCSKNNESDVFAVFEKRPDMPLKHEHLVCWRINWNMKSENLKSIANELNLGLDSFIFIDDNPVECADVKINCPQVLTLQLPDKEDCIASFLQNIWPLDKFNATIEDKQRTRMYKENIQRERYRGQAPSLRSFLVGLQLSVRISNPTEEQISRVSQLTYRTNQFNLTTIRRTEGEIRRLIEQEHYKCLVTHVSDRFGDYGLVSVVLYEDKGEFYSVDTFLLSCRVLGRGVEHRILASIGQRSLDEGKRFIEIKFVPSKKNFPAFGFIESVGGRYREKADEISTYRIPAEILACLEYAPENNGDTEDEKISHDQETLNKDLHDTKIIDLSEKIQRIGNEMTGIDAIFNAIEIHRSGKQEIYELDSQENIGQLENKILTIWQKVLGKARIGLNANFFEIGGTSLKAVQIIALIKKELKFNLSIVNLFECPSVALLSKKLESNNKYKSDNANVKMSLDRGKKRRQRKNMLKKKYRSGI